MTFAAANALQRYQAVQVTTASPGHLLVMLYDGLFRFLGEAHTAIRNQDRGRAGERISRSHAILEQLLMGLNAEIAPALCERLEPLYLFCMAHLVEANIRQDPTRIEEVIRVLGPLREAWKEAVRQVDLADHS